MARKTRASAKNNRTNVLPFEIWRECFMLLDLSDHKSLAIVCRPFHDICMAFILESITYSSVVTFYKGGNLQVPFNQVSRLNEDMERFQKLSKNRRHAPLVRKLTLVYTLRLSVSADPTLAATAKEAYGPFIDTLVKSIPTFVNLREVKIDFNKNMDKKVLATLAKLPHLESISFIAVKFGAHQLKPPLKMRTLSINNTQAGHGFSVSNPNPSAKRLDLFSGDLLEELTVRSCVYAPKIFRSLTDQQPLNHLNTLSFQLKAKNVALLYLFLANCPNLESLVAGINYDDDLQILNSFPQLPPSTVPKLKSFAGLPSAAKAFVPGRPVEKALLMAQPWIEGNPPDTNDIFQYLAMSSVPITDLDFDDKEFVPEVMASIKVDLPSLTKLRLALIHDLFDEDPRDIELDPVVSDKPPIRIADSKASEPPIQLSQTLLPRYIRTPYMTAVHWIAHRKFDLPANLETLHLQESGFYVDGSESDSDIPDNESILENFPELRQYTFSMAASVFNALSIHYPALRSVLISLQQDGEVCWVRDMTGQWECSRRKGAGRITHLFMTY